ncbi:MAG: 5-formyltetrahydrofolate cyclo-ligase [Deltaproteobacteria bacterium]|nr:5-formyltetrahydrofolate cyclo-ligase [Deltaproteobacteria bacterium]
MGRVAIEEKKRALRQAVLFRRNALSSQDCLIWSQAIQSRALQLPAYNAALSLALYSPVQNEVATEDIFSKAISTERKIFYPRTRRGGAGEFIRVTSGADLCAGRFGILEPTGTEALCESDRRGLIVYVPGVAFDIAGNRLGRGRGWYDRLLAWLENKATLVALAYDFQVVEIVPTEAWDRKVHYVVTETRIIDCDAANAPLRHASQ